ncbi:MAG TPA: protein kinase [Candidatus Acidoferrales bacterium]|nr:protein kinase [Candidatus Acidoferrales bacterium]
MILGKNLGHYRVQEKIGAGGMGEVYRATDAKLGRDVAIKVLPELFTKDAERLARFDREARVLASLNHPNIATIHGLEEAGDLRYLVMELVPGLTLAERLARGPVPLEEALSIVRQMAEALEVAHEKGVIHRDLKPSNIKVTPEGTVKILDFGLAKAFATEASSQDISGSPTVSLMGTRGGAILGTVPYMSPEQARGKPLDRRTDIWAFGCILYELLTGRQAFRGETESDTIAKVLEREPDWRALPARTPSRVRTLLSRCLHKDAHHRIQHIGDARIEVEEALAAPRTMAGDETPDIGKLQPARWGKRLLFISAGTAFLGVLATWTVVRIVTRPVSASFSVNSVGRLTHDPGLSEWPTWSPDGSLLAFASNRRGNFEIYVRRVEGGQEVNVTNDPGEDFQPAFSPDGNSLAFISTRSSQSGMIKIGMLFGFEFRTYGGDLWLAPALGGQARRIAQNANFPAWHPRERKIAYVSGVEDHRSILEVPAEGGAPIALLPSESSSWEIVRLNFSPSGNWISFETVDEGVMLVPRGGGAPHKLVDGISHVWDANGRRLYYLTRDHAGGTRLLAAEIDEARGVLAGSPQTVGLVTGILRDLAVSRDAQQFAVSQLEGSMNLTRLPLTPTGGTPSGPEEQLSSGQVIDRYPAFSPDGRRIAFASDRLGAMEMWIYDVTSRIQQRLQLPGKDLGVNLPNWSPDGRTIVVTRFFQDGTRSLWLTATDGSHAEEVHPPGRGNVSGFFSPDGRQLLYFFRTEGFTQIHLMDIATRKKRQLTTSRSDKYDADWSPDGRWIAYSSNAGGTMQLWRIPTSGGDEQQLTSGHERMRHVSYSPDGRWIYSQPSHRNICRLPSSGGSLEAVTRFPESGLFIEEPKLSPDGRYLVYSRSNGGSSLWLLRVGKAQ